MKTTDNFFSLLAGLPGETVLTRNELRAIKGGSTNGLPAGEDEDILIPPPDHDEEKDDEDEDEGGDDNED